MFNFKKKEKKIKMMRHFTLKILKLISDTFALAGC